VTSDPIRICACHCLACQRRTGSVSCAQARFVAGSVTLTDASKAFVRVGGEGTRTTFRFCPECGSTVYCTAEGIEDSIGAPVGAFADSQFPSPRFSVYEEHMHGRVSLPPGIEHIE
jgi:hypothetical protein